MDPGGPGRLSHEPDLSVKRRSNARVNTTYIYDTRGLLTSRTRTDAGTAASEYDYGRNLRFAQDAKQAAAGQVAFTGYDFANRPLKSGVGTATFATSDPNAAPGTLQTTNTN